VHVPLKTQLAATAASSRGDPLLLKVAAHRCANTKDTWGQAAISAAAAVRVNSAGSDRGE